MVWSLIHGCGAEAGLIGMIVDRKVEEAYSGRQFQLIGETKGALAEHCTLLQHVRIIVVEYHSVGVGGLRAGVRAATKDRGISRRC